MTLADDARAGKARPVYLLHGEEFLARKAAEELVEALVPAGRFGGQAGPFGHALTEFVMRDDGDRHGMYVQYVQ